jgi:predicted  nucleic acid-binding Zn-ribbon protein
MSRSSALYDLQLIDSQLDKHKKRLHEIALILSDEREINKAKSILNKKTDQLEASNKELQAAEQKVKDQRLKIKQTDAMLYGGKIRNPKELQDLQDEWEALKRFLNILEDRQLEHMLLVDDKKKQHNVAQENLDKTLAKSQLLHEQLIQEKNKIKIQNQDLENRQHSCHAMIAKNDLEIYERIKKQRFGVAVAKVKDKACSACGVTLTAAINQAARSPNQITNCENCGRILYSQ